MKEYFLGKHELSKHRKLLAYVALVVLLSLSAYIWLFWSNTKAEKEQKRYEEHTKRIVSAIAERLHHYMMVLRGGAGLFVASEDVTRNEWRIYFEYRQIGTFFPGIQSIGFSRVVLPPELARHIQGIRAEGFPDYMVWPAGERDVYTAIIFLEPFNARNQRAFGYDMFSEPVRRAAMERARDTGAISISGKVTLVQETDKKVQAGFLMYVPIYAKGMSLNTTEERRVALTGYVYSPFRMNDLMHGIFQGLEHEVEFKIYDGTEVSPEGLMYECDEYRRAPDEKHKPTFSSRQILDLYGHSWTLAFENRLPFEAAVDQWTSWGILTAGLLLSLLAFFFIRTLENAREHALSLAQEITFALKESEEKYRVLNDNLPLAVSIIGPNMEIIAANATKRKWFHHSGYGKESPCFPSCNLPSRTEPCEGCPVVKTFQDGQMHTAEREATTSQGIRSLVITAVALTDPDGKVISVHQTMEDVTERRRSEQDRTDRKIAEEANRTKSVFVANMSHEIRTPLNAIIGFAQLLLRDPLLTPRQQKDVETINRSGNNLLRLINDILDMSKIEAGRSTLAPAAFCLHDLVDDLELMFRSRAEAKGLRLLIERGDSVPRYVTADEGKLRQAFSNLLDNAIKFTEQGSIVMRVAAEVVEERSGDVHLVVEVEDSGPGISKEEQSRLFQIFQQASAGAKMGGTGLGLAISRKILRMMGGDITVESEVGRGTCFRFDVVVQLAEAGAVKRKAPPRRVIGLHPDVGTVRALVVDDNPDNRVLMRALLLPVGFEVREAGNGVEALDLFEQWSPHVVLMDMRMPVMDGYEATRRLKGMETGRATPIIAVTASAFGEDESTVMEAGVDAYIRKPFQEKEIFATIERLLGLRYVYTNEKDETHAEPEAAALTPEALAALPKELIQAMRQAVAEGDMASLTELIGQVEKVDSNVARGLQALADRYDYEKLGEWLEQGGIDNG